MPSDTQKSKTLLRRKAVCRDYSISESSLDAMVARGEFPKPIKMSPGRTAWIAAEIDAWLADKARRRARVQHEARPRPQRQQRRVAR
jgi:prophage regulatory protein